MKNEKRLQGVPESLRSHLLLNARMKGACQTLVGNIAVCVLLLDDQESSWDEEAIQACESNFQNQLSELKRESENYQVKLDMKLYFYRVKTNLNLQWGFSTPCIKDALDKAGLPPYETFSKQMCKELQVDEAPIVVALNKKGRSFAVPSYTKDNAEYALLYCDAGKYSLVHELSHIFGAKDYYYPEILRSYAQKLLGDNIMLNISCCVMDDLNAYLIGWCNVLSPKAIAFLKETSDITKAQFEAGYDYSVFSGYVERQIGNGMYYGNLEKGVVHGHGRMVWDNGMEYEGEWNQAKKHGFGIMKWDTCTYKGMWEQNQFHGAGILTWDNGASYSGAFVNGKKEGYGIMKWANGTVYEGFWQDDERHGQGTMKYKNGVVEEGFWEKGTKVKYKGWQ